MQPTPNNTFTSTKKLVVPTNNLGASAVRCSKHPVVRTERERFGDYVRRVADEEKLKYREIARRGGISAPTVSDIISGKTKEVKGSTLIALAKGLGRSPEEVFAAYQGGSPRGNGDTFDSEIAVIFKGFDELSDKDKAELLGTVKMLASEIQRRRPKNPSGKTGGKREK